MPIIIPVASLSGKRPLLQMVNNVCAEIGMPVLSSLVGNTDNTAVQMFALANREGRELTGDTGQWGGWPQLRVEYVINLAIGVDNYDFPSDFSYIIPDTEWSRSYRWQLLGPLSAQEWQVLKSGLSPTGPRTRWRIMSGRIYFDPVPAQVQQISFEYYADTWACSAAGVPQNKFIADSDLFLLPDDAFELGLKWRFLRAKGLDYAQEYKDYVYCIEREKSWAGSVRNLPLNASSPRGINLLSSNNIPDTGFGI